VTIGPKAGTLTGKIEDSVTGLPVNPITDCFYRGASGRGTAGSSFD